MGGARNETVPDLVITRLFDAPRAMVWKAWTDPKLTLRWLGPRHHPAVRYQNDARPGGAWSALLRPQDGGPDLGLGGVYHEIVEPERLVFSFAWANDHPAQGHDTLVTIEFTDLGDQTRMVFRQTGLPSQGEVEGHTEGWTSAFERLDDALNRR